MTTHDKPWIKPYDINGDGGFGVDDMQASIYNNPVEPRRPIDLTHIDEDCRCVKIGFLKDEAMWKLKQIIAEQPRQADTSILARRVNDLQMSISIRFGRLSAGAHCTFITRQVSLATNEMVRRARRILQSNSANEPFGIGIQLVPNQSSESGFPLSISALHPASAAAAAGLLRGDILTAIDGLSPRQRSIDGTIEGLIDPETQLARGLGGPRNSNVTLTLRRGARTFDVNIKRNIWSARRLSAPETAPLWDGK
jgi:hypothetical protein